MWLQLARSSNNPEVPDKHFLHCVAECGGCPVKVRNDCGTEMMFLLQSNARS